MAFFAWLLLISISSIQSSLASLPYSGVSKLNEDAVSAHEYVLVNYRAPWCAPWCAVNKAIYPEIDKAAQLLPATKLPVRIVLVNADEDPDIARQYDIRRTIPDLRLFRDGVPLTYYAGPTEANSLVRYLEHFVGPDVVTLDSDDAVIDFIESALPHFAVNIALGVDKFNISKVARTFKGRAFFAHAQNVSEDLLRKYGVQKLPAFISLHPDYGEQEIFYGDTHYGCAECFAEVNLLPLALRIEENNMELLAHANTRMIVLTIMEDSETENAKALIETMKRMAPPHREYILFAYVDIKQYKLLTDIFNLDTSQTILPVMLIWKFADRGNNMDMLGYKIVQEGEDREHQITELIKPLVIAHEKDREKLKNDIYYASDFWALKLKLIIFQIIVIILVLGHFVYKTLIPRIEAARIEAAARNNRPARNIRPAAEKDD